MSEAVDTGRVKRHNRRPPPGKGRPPGVPNIINRDIKEMILGALSDVGGRSYLAEQAQRNPNAFMGLLGRVLPLAITGRDGGPLSISWDMSGFTQPAIASPTAPMIEGSAVRDAVEVADDAGAHRNHGEGEVGEAE